MSSHGTSHDHTLQCMEIWGGFERTDRSVSTPGLDLWVFNHPFHGDSQGGDVYYLTLCGGGVITRVVVADVAGHGAAVAEFAAALRTILRKNINRKSQKSIVERLNQQFSAMADKGRFATALVVTYLASKDRLSILNAGHPRPLLYRAARGEWTSIGTEANGTNGPANLPLGLDDQTNYHTVDLNLEPGDRLIFYTDALVEAADPSGAMLGEPGLLDLARSLSADISSPAALGGALLAAVTNYRGGVAADDDVTLVVLHHTATATPRLSLAQKADVYAKVFGLRRV